MRVIAILLLLALPAHAEVAPGCQSAMEQALSGYAGCRLLALSKDTRRPDAAKLAGSLAACATRFEAAAYKALGRYGTGSCPPTSVAQFRAYIEGLADGASAAAGGEALPDVAPCLATPVPTATPSPACTPYSVDNGNGGTYTNNCDGTVTDSTTRLQWELKRGAVAESPVQCTFETPCVDPHDVNNIYTLNRSGLISDRTVESIFLAQLNCTDSFSGYGCQPFNGHRDWRLPSLSELVGLYDRTASVCGPPDYTAPCSKPIFDPVLRHPYWSSSHSFYVPNSWVADFYSGSSFGVSDGPYPFAARAVRDLPAGP